ncbi:lysine 5,6-aminomutase subunit alpha [Clostridium sp. 'deep sea']|uniref:lysine 5,6-aminomutase subunit alpha n=1 Tax=Clostridium sp. 'deep sea' TaxID=2779445 RepID=UPI00189669A2|nr:lysine 5,6-aminomutase subunit alpha [Clostridium sp. 'deep sea']QOR37022.1 lysine 5,6-aminomutase subunit alpha [Clostridium sp. 'deep sea']
MSLVERARNAAEKIAGSVQEMVDQHTTITVERTVARLMGIDGIDSFDVPLPNVVVDHVHQQNKISRGIAWWIGNAMVYYGLTPQQVAEKVALGEIDLVKVPLQDEAEIDQALDLNTCMAMQKIKENRNKRDELCKIYPPGKTPQQYVIVATGNIYEDITQARSAVRQGADIIAVIRTTGQSLLDYVPYGPTTEGFGGTYATQANFAIMREALDEVGAEVGRYIQLVNYCSGLCMPEIAVMGAFERLDMMLNDSMYGILFRDINMKRTFVDQYFSRMINAYAGVVINTGEDNYLTTADAFEEGHTVTASQLINEQLALLSGLPHEQMGLGHAFEMNPNIENGLLYEIAQAQLSRELFPNCPLKYMPPTKYMTGDIFKGQVQDALFNLVSVLTGQGIHLLGMLTEAIHTPFMQDRAIALQNSKYVMNTARDLGDEISFKDGGIIQTRAKQVIFEACEMLEDIESIGIEEALSRGMFANVKRTPEGGKGLSGVIKRANNYCNPFIKLLQEELQLKGEY